jgi:hypothetical protein
MKSFSYRQFIIAAFVMLFAASSYALTTIDGIVKDSINQPVDVATVNLFRATDSVFVKAEITDVDGRFQFVEIPAGSYYVIISFIGFNDYSSDVFQVSENQASFTIPEIRLLGDGLSLNELSVVAQRPFVERRADRLIVNVENSIISAGSSAMEVLERAPGVIVSANDAISIRGRSGVIFMIDGKITPMSGQDLANYLRGLPSNSIDRIEIITNPSAKYDAAGNAGIIDIRLKKSTANGTNGSITANVAQGVYPKAGGGINLNHRKDKWNVYGAYNYNFRKGFNDLRLYRSFFEEGQRTGAYDQKNYLVIPYHFNMGRIGIDYYASQNTVIGILASGNINKFQPGGQNTSRVENGEQETISTFATKNESEDVWPSYSLNGNLKHTFPKGKQELTVDVDYANYSNETTQNFTTRYYDLDGKEYLPYYLLVGDLQGELDIKSIKADFSWPINDKARFEAGGKSSVVNADNDLAFYDESDIENPIYDSTISNHFLYEEQIHAAYVNFNYTWPKFSIQSGLRVEQTIADGLQLVNNKNFNRDYTNIFPSVFLNYNFSEKYAMGLNMSRRLDRPSYQQLNPFKFFLDPSTYREGNAFLNPQFTWSFEWNHTLFQRYTATVSYSRTNDNITQVIAPVEGLERVTVQTDINLGEVDYYSFNTNIPITIGKIWNSNNNFSLYYGRYRGNYANTPLNNGNVVGDFRTNNSFTFAKDWSAELNFFYHTSEKYAYMHLEPMWGLGTGVQKMLFNKRASIKLSVTDIFWTSLPAADITFRDYTETFDVYRDSRQVALAYTHRFGDNKLAPSRRRSGGAEEEKQRAAQQQG